MEDKFYGIIFFADEWFYIEDCTIATVPHLMSVFTIRCREENLKKVHQEIFDKGGKIIAVIRYEVKEVEVTAIEHRTRMLELSLGRMDMI